MPGRRSSSSVPSLHAEDWQKIWRRLKELCLLTQRTNSHLLSVTARPDDIFGDAVTFTMYKGDLKRKKSYRDINTFSSFVSVSDFRRSESTELRIQW